MTGEGLFGLSWRALRNIAIYTWVGSFIAWWVYMPASWSGIYRGADYIRYTIWTCLTAIPMICTIVPGIASLLSPRIRAQLFTLPVAAALSAVALAFVIVTVGLMLWSVAANGIDALSMKPSITEKGFASWPELAVFLSIGIAAFVMTFGLIFPLGIPLACGLVVMLTAKRCGKLSRAAWIAAVVVASIGWLGTYIAGVFMGLGG